MHSKNWIPIAITLFPLFFIISCKQVENTFEKTADFSIVRNGKTTLIDGIEINDRFSLVLLNYDSMQINFVNYQTRKIRQSIKLNNVFDKQELKNIAPNQFLVHTSDSVFIGLPNSNLVLLIDGQGKLTNTWDLNKIYSGGVEIVFLPSLPMYFNNNILYIGNASRDYVGDEEGRKIYFGNVSPIIAFNVKDMSVSKLPLKFPGIYQTGKDYKDYHIAQCMALDKNIFSFKLDHHMYVYKGMKFIKKAEVKSKFWKKPTPYPDDSARNFYFLKKYNRSETRYDRIIYDKYRNLYYRLVNLPTQFERGDGTIADGNDWSCMILDSNFKVLDEIFFDYNKYFSYYFIPSPDGVLIGDSEKALADKSKLSLALFKINIHD